MIRCPLFVELCAGTAAVSLSLHGGRKARPPVSRMGSKRGYASAILGACGLYPGERAEHYLWCEPDPGVRLLLEAYRDPELAREAAAIIRGWADEEPRALWERLRAEGPPKGPEPREVARFVNLEGWTNGGRYMGPDRPSSCHPPGWVASITSEGLAGRCDDLGGLPATITDDARKVDPREVARWSTLQRWGYGNAPITHNGKRWIIPHNGPDSPSTFGANNFGSTETTANGLERDGCTGLPATITDDARKVDPREVARWSLLGQWSYRRGHPESGINGGLLLDREPTANGGHAAKARTCEQEAALWNGCPVVDATITDDARRVEPVDLPPGTVAYIDPPYAPLSAVVPPVLAAEHLTPGPCDRSEADAALLASGLDGAGEAVGHLRVAILEVLRSAGVQTQILQPVVERVVVDVVDDLIWGQWASKVAFHDKSVFGDCAPLVANEPVAVACPPSPLAGAPLGGLLLPFRGHLRRTLAEFYVATANPSTVLPQALAWADRILSVGARPVSADKVSPADVALDVERHCRLRSDVRQGISTSMARPPGKAVTGYGHDLPRAEVVALARRWADAGALVVISEQEPLPALMAEGWHSMRLTSTRRGQKRTFSKQQEEWLTMSAPPVVRPLVQESLFG